MARTAHIVRETSESHIDLELNLERHQEQTDIDTSVPFYNHKMTALGKHSLIDLTIHAHGDTTIDAPHCGRYGHRVRRSSEAGSATRKASAASADATVPLDEALRAKTVVDISGRPYACAAASPKATNSA